MPESRQGEGPKARRPNLGPSAGPANRRALLAAAREIFAADGLAAPFSAIAKRAGVGQGSLYRHFPDRLSLAVAVYEENLDELEAAVAPPEAGLDELLEGIIAQALVSTALIDLISANPHDPRVEKLGARVSDIAAAAVEHERAAGRFGDHVDVDDVLLAISMLAGVLARTEPDARAGTAQRAWTLLHAAFAPRPAYPVPRPAHGS